MLLAAISGCSSSDEPAGPTGGAGQNSSAGTGGSPAAGGGGSVAAGSGGAGASGGSAAGGSAAGGGAAGGSAAPADPTQLIGTFAISLEAPTDADPAGHTAVGGSVSDGPTPELTVWEEAMSSGDCKLSTPRVPFCSTPCGGTAACVEDEQCQPRPTKKSVGAVRVTGVRTAGGESEFSMEPIGTGKAYQTPAGTQLPYPAFDDGAELSIAAAGAELPAFSINARGIVPLVLGAEEYALERGQPLALTWTKGATADARIHVKLDISHHGGSKGEIECETADSGSLTIAGELIGSLIDKGVAGFPTIEVRRQTRGTASLTQGVVELIVVSEVVLPVEVPGLTSCSEDTDCPEGQTCAEDLSCK